MRENVYVYSIHTHRDPHTHTDPHTDPHPHPHPPTHPHTHTHTHTFTHARSIKRASHVKVWLLAARLRVDADEPQELPDLVEEEVEVELGSAREDDRLVALGDTTDLLDARHVDLVVHAETAHVLAVPFDQIDELLNGAVLTEQDLCRVDSVLVEDLSHRSLRDLLEPTRGRDGDAARLFSLKVDIRRLLVQP